MIEVDARGLSCPEPVLLTMNAMKSHKSEQIRVLVDEAHAKENVRKCALNQGRKVTVTENGIAAELLIE